MKFYLTHHYPAQNPEDHPPISSGFRTNVHVRVSRHNTALLPGGTPIQECEVNNSHQESMLEFYSINNDIHLHFYPTPEHPQLKLSDMHIREVGSRDEEPRCTLYLHLHEARNYYFGQTMEVAKSLEAEGDYGVEHKAVCLRTIYAELTFD